MVKESLKSDSSSNPNRKVLTAIYSFPPPNVIVDSQHLFV